MDAPNNAYFQPLLFHPQTSSMSTPMIYPTSLQEQQDMEPLPYDTMNPYDSYDPSYPCSMSYGQPMSQTPLSQWMQQEQQRQTLSSYPRQTSSSPYMTNLSPPAAESLCYHSDHQHDSSREMLSRVPSFTSMSSCAWASPRASDHPRSDMSRSASPNASEMARYGHLQAQGTWRCAFPGCTSKSIFRRGCDLRKHYRRHTKSLFCRYAGCKQASDGGFSSEKDRARHEAKHDPQIACEWKGCGRVFSRVDNMVCWPFLKCRILKCMFLTLE